MVYKIQKGEHIASPLLLKFFWKIKSIEKIVTFGNGTFYDLKDEDQLDANKLFGLGFFNLKKWPMHHYESVRIGWRADLLKGGIDLLAYTYTKGLRQIKYLCTIQLDMPTRIVINTSPKEYEIEINFFNGTSRETRSVKIDRGITSKLSYFLGPYFGGNESAPHDMQIKIT